MEAVRQRGRATLAVFFAAFVLGAPPVLAQAPLTLEEAMKRAQGETAEARALASMLEEAGARVRQAQSGFWPRVDVTETVQRGNQPVFVFSSLLAQRRFSAATFAIPALNHPVLFVPSTDGIEAGVPVANGPWSALRHGP